MSEAMREAANDVLLAVDCSLRRAGIAVVSGAVEMKVLSELDADIGPKLASELPVLAEGVIRDSGVGLREITHVAVTNGPGYFTGARIGMSWSVALAFGIGARVVPVGTFEALMSPRPADADADTDAGAGAGAKDDTPALYLVYAGRNSVYAASRGFSADLPVREYGTDYIAEWADAQRAEAFRVYLDNPGKIILPPSVVSLAESIRKIEPRILGTAKVGWDNRAERSVRPFDFRANWCRSPV